MPGRKYVSDFQIGIGPVNLTGSLYGLRKTGSGDSNKFTSICPDCETPTKPSQQYACPTDATHVHPMSELHKAKEIGGELVRVDVEQVTEARTSQLPLNVFRASIHPVADVADATWHADNSYVFIPNRADEYFGLAVKMVSESGKAFVAMSNVRNSEGFYRLEVWKGYLVMQKLHWPEECETFTPINVECDDSVFAAAMNMLDKMEEPFDADGFRSSVKLQLESLESALWNGTEIPAMGTPLPVEKPDLLAVLAAFDG